jgi:hypothetical protein
LVQLIALEEWLCVSPSSLELPEPPGQWSCSPRARRGRIKVYQGVWKGEVMTDASLASLESSLAVNSGRPWVPSPSEVGAEEGEGRELARLTRFGPLLAAGPAQARRREKGGRERAARPRLQLGRQRRLDRAERESVKEIFSFSIF